MLKRVSEFWRDQVGRKEISAAFLFMKYNLLNFYELYFKKKKRGEAPQNITFKESIKYQTKRP